MEPSGARTRSSGSGRFAASTTICGLRFNGAKVAVWLAVGGGGCRGANVSVTVTGGRVGLDDSRTAGREVGVIPHPKETIRHKISIKLFVPFDFIRGSLGLDCTSDFGGEAFTYSLESRHVSVRIQRR